MIDLNDINVKRDWLERDEKVIEIISNMEERETWTLDESEEIKQAIVKWGSNLNEEKIEFLLNENPKALVLIFAFMKSKRSLLALNSIEEKVSGFIAELLRESLDNIATEKGDVRAQMILRDRLVALFRVDLIERIFSSERCEKIKAAIRATTESEGGLYE